MGVTVKKAVLWRKDISNKPGTLADSLKGLSDARVDLQVVMGYAIPGNAGKAAVEVYPITSAKAEAAAKKAGLKPGQVACLLVEGDNKTGLAHNIAKAISDARINMNFAVIQVIGKKYTGMFGFEKMNDALAATPLIKQAASGKSGAKSKAKSKAKSSGKVLKLTKPAKGKKGTAKKAAMRKKTGGKKKAAKKSKRK